MDENNNKSPLSYDAPTSGEYSKPEETKVEETKVEETKVEETVTEAAKVEEPTATVPSAFEAHVSNPVDTSSHQEVFGGQVEGNATANYASNNYGAPEEFSKGFAIASLVMGILSLLSCCCTFLSIIFGILGIIFSCVQKKDAEGNKPGMAIVGLILSILGLVISVGSIIYVLCLGGAASYQDILNSMQ
ncbi:MAG: DUF4190 domain-containing protein [Lachnospiraceae bacterium]|nr:DUF4190 domain-containing protein [Lachnospiraceae bacterium]